MKIKIGGKQKKSGEVRNDRFTWEAGDVVWEKKPSDKEEEKEDVSKTTDKKKMKLLVKIKGGPGSGNWAHIGRPGVIGGSVSNRTTMSTGKGSDWLERYSSASGHPHKEEAELRAWGEEERKKGKVLVDWDGSKTRIGSDTVELSNGNVIPKTETLKRKEQLYKDDKVTIKGNFLTVNTRGDAAHRRAIAADQYEDGNQGGQEFSKPDGSIDMMFDNFYHAPKKSYYYNQ